MMTTFHFKCSVHGDESKRDITLKTRDFQKEISQYLDMMALLLSQQPYSFKDEAIKIPEKPGVYAISDDSLNGVIYVGRTKSLKRRLMNQHRSGNMRGSQFRKALQHYASLKSEQEITNYIKNNCNFRYKIEEDFEKQIRLEHFTTAILGPILNTKLKQ